MNRRAHRVSHIEANLVLVYECLVTITEVVLGIVICGKKFTIKKISSGAVIVVRHVPSCRQQGRAGQPDGVVTWKMATYYFRALVLPQ